MTKQKYKNLDPIWAKAALLGSMWGSIEIIVGSFLHNLRIPMTGTILSAIGVSLLIGGHYLWKEKGLIWRAGVVCALMKSISPSAVIIGPMVGILTEAFVLDFLIRMSGGLSIGVFIGSGIVVCLPFVQSIINLIITYGFNVASIYVGVYKIVVKNIGMQNISIYRALGIFFSLNAIFGFFAAFAGMAIGKRAATETLDTIPTAIEGKNFLLPPVITLHRFSIILLIASCAIIPFMLFAISNLTLLWSLLLVATYTVIMVKRYPNCWNSLSRIKIWIGMIIIILLSGLLLGEITNIRSGWTWGGIFVGLQMSLRAIFMVVAFNVISVELRNPKIINWVLRRGLGQLATAMEVAFDALPTLIASLGEQRNVLRHPIISLSRLFLVAQHRMRQLKLGDSTGNKIYILTGEQGTGKTMFLSRLVDELRKKNIQAGGILSPSVQRDSVRLGYDVLNIRTGERTILCRNEPGSTGINIGKWIFRNDGIQSGNSALDQLSLIGCGLVIIDEVGPLELENKVWCPSLNLLVGSSPYPLILVVREKLIERVTDRWSFIPEAIWKISRDNSEELLVEITDAIIRPINQL
ncbi:MAG: nucleoside-triphosphatase [Ignavibacteriaceae bacterium]|nr:nucleoside-triphosphatase [Ignavibacteriaceae bacterium]